MIPLQLTHRSFALQSALSWPTSAHLEQVGWPRQTVLNDQIFGIESNAADLGCMGRTGQSEIGGLYGLWEFRRRKGQDEMLCVQHLSIPPNRNTPEHHRPFDPPYSSLISSVDTFNKSAAEMTPRE
ncbi:hypothetical protein TNCV_842581 [Trichonephila clavipes]|nr:hypothetical protein TNCV_842581 [Trichonephila clavipes]